jgi:hypothetical protein
MLTPWGLGSTRRQAQHDRYDLTQDPFSQRGLASAPPGAGTGPGHDARRTTGRQTGHQAGQARDDDRGGRTRPRFCRSVRPHVPVGPGAVRMPPPRTAHPSHHQPRPGGVPLLSRWTDRARHHLASGGRPGSARNARLARGHSGALGGALARARDHHRLLAEPAAGCGGERRRGRSACLRGRPQGANPPNPPPPPPPPKTKHRAGDPALPPSPRTTRNPRTSRRASRPWSWPATVASCAA